MGFEPTGNPHLGHPLDSKSSSFNQARTQLDENFTILPIVTEDRYYKKPLIFTIICRITTYILLLWLEEAHYVRAYTCPAVYGMVKGAGDKTRTCNIQFGRLSLYRLSYAREIGCSPSGFHSTGYPDRDMQDSSEH